MRTNLIISFFGATTYGWDKLDNALNHSHLPSSTQKFAKKLGVKAGDVSKAPVPFLSKRRPPFTTQTLNHSLPQQHYNAPLHPAPTFQQSFPMPPPAPPPFFLFLGNNDRALCISRCKRNRTADTCVCVCVCVCLCFCFKHSDACNTCVTCRRWSCSKMCLCCQTWSWTHGQLAGKGLTTAMV